VFENNGEEPQRWRGTPGVSYSLSRLEVICCQKQKDHAKLDGQGLAGKMWAETAITRSSLKAR
jgi:hypothetical protein